MANRLTKRTKSSTDRQTEGLAAGAMAEACWQTVFHLGAVGVIQTSLDGTMALANPCFCQWLGYGPEALLGVRLQDVTYGPDWERESELLEQIRSGRQDRCALAKRFIRKDGTLMWSHVTWSVVRDAKGEAACALGIVQETAARTAAEEALEQERSAAKERAHQLRTLATELTQAEQRERRRWAQYLHDHLQQILVAANMKVNVLQQEEDVTAMRAALKEIDGLICESIDASRSLTAELSPQILYDVGLVAALEWLARRFQQRHGLMVEVEVRGEVGHVEEGVRVFLFQAARELLFNVVKHAQTDRSRIVLSALPGRRIEMVVEDRGQGFKDDGLPAKGDLGEHFGLFGIRERLEVFGGELSVESGRDGGVRVAVQIPTYSWKEASGEEESMAPILPVAASQSGPSTPPAPASSPKPVRVLLVDDHKILRDGLVGLLKEAPGIEVVGEAGDGLEAVDLTRQMRPDAVVMDINMPQLSGLDATRLIAADFPDVRIIGLSIHETEDMMTAMLQAGAAAYIPKGGPAKDLIAAIRGEARAV